MAKQLENMEEKLVDKAQKPIDKLFRHHLEDVKKNHGDEMSTYNAIDNVRKQIEQLIDLMTEKVLFNDYFSDIT